MPLVVLGLIAVGAALLLIFYSRRPGGSSGAGWAKRVQAQVVPEKHYKKSEDGKVVYLFGDDGDEAPQEQGAADPSDAHDVQPESPSVGPDDPGRDDGGERE